MPQDDVVAVRAGAAGDLDGAVARRQHGSADRCGVIDAAMGHGPLEQRVAALEVEVGTDAREVYRRAQEAPAHGIAFGTVVFGVPGAADVPHGPVTTALVDEFRCQDRAELDRVSVVLALLVDDVESIAGADVEHEVDVPAKDVRELQRDAVVQADTLARVEQRTLDDRLAMHPDDIGFLR